MLFSRISRRSKARQQQHEAQVRTLEAALQVSESRSKEMERNAMIAEAVLAQLLSERSQDKNDPAASVPQTECVVCMDERCNTVLLPCGHLCLCAGCTSELKQQGVLRCPLCRVTVTQTKQVFMPLKAQSPQRLTPPSTPPLPAAQALPAPQPGRAHSAAQVQDVFSEEEDAGGGEAEADGEAETEASDPHAGAMGEGEPEAPFVFQGEREMAGTGISAVADYTAREAGRLLQLMAPQPATEPETHHVERQPNSEERIGMPSFSPPPSPPQTPLLVREVSSSEAQAEQLVEDALVEEEQRHAEVEQLVTEALSELEGFRCLHLLL
jgi:hypothetical protein